MFIAWSEYPVVHITGSVQTRQFFNESFSVTAANEIKMIFESIPLIESSTVLMTGTEQFNFKRRKRSAERAVINFISMCFVRVSKIIPIPEEMMNEIESNITIAINKMNPCLYDIFDEESFDSVELSFAQPRVIEVSGPLQSEQDIKIGLTIIRWLSK